MARVQDKVSIVTGAAGGLGASITKHLLREGGKVVATDIDSKRLELVLDGYMGDRLLTLGHDVSCEAGWEMVVGASVSTFGGLDVLVNNAGVVLAGSVEDTSLDDFRRVNSVHSEGTFLGCKHGIPAMRDSGDGSGSIINMSSVTAIGGFPYVFAYSAAKGAVRAMTKSIAATMSISGEPIRCNSIHPGRIQTDMIDQCREQRQATEDSSGVATGNPPGIPDDIAYLVVYLASDESIWVNGSEFVVDNGATITDGQVQRRVRK